MAIQIANKIVIQKIEALARADGISKTAAVEKAVDRMLTERQADDDGGDAWQHFDAILAQIDRIPDVERPEPIEWDDWGLPR